MASSFFGIEIAKTGLFMSQKQLNLTGHNIANATTPGYTRQRIITESIDPHGVHVRWALGEHGRVGGGVTLQTLERVRDEYIDRQLRQEYGTGGETLTRADALSYIESIFDEVENPDLSNALAGVFNAMEELSTDTASETYRTDLRTKIDTFTELLSMYYDKLEKKQTDINDEMKVRADRCNDLMDMITEYNRQIYKYELTGENANDLRDKRDLLVDELATYIDIKYEETGNKLSITMRESDQLLISHTDSYKLEARDNAGRYDIYVVDSTSSATPPDTVLLDYRSGEMQGLRGVRDGNTSEAYGIPYIMEQLNTLAEQLFNVLNPQHEAGYTIPSTANPTSVDDIPLFTLDASLPPAKGLQLNQAIRDDIWLFACSSEEVDGAINRGNNENMLELLKLVSNDSTSAVNGTSFEGYLKSTLTELGSQSAKAQSLNTAQVSVLFNLEDKREAVSGVSIDEEVTLMLQFQYAYQANSRVLTALDQALDVLINRTGVVGL